jgi:dihydroorotate dehydrogenase (fumarate)
VATDPGRDAAQVESELVELAASVASAATVPVAVKIGPAHTAPAHFARRLEEAGAAGIVVFHRLHDLDVDLARRSGRAGLYLSSPVELSHRLRWVAILRARVGGSLAATGGVWSGEAAAKALLAGADVVEVASVLIERGPEHMQTLTRELEQALEQGGFGSVAEARGLLALAGEGALDSDAMRDRYVAALLDATARIRTAAADRPGSGQG